MAVAVITAAAGRQQRIGSSSHDNSCSGISSTIDTRGGSRNTQTSVAAFMMKRVVVEVERYLLLQKEEGDLVSAQD